jgi:hypothetical protein
MDDRGHVDLTGESEMTAQPGDRLVIGRPDVGVRPRDGEVLEVQGQDGGPPYLVRWSDDGNAGLVFPGAHAKVQHLSMAMDVELQSIGRNEGGKP